MHAPKYVVTAILITCSKSAIAFDGEYTAKCYAEIKNKRITLSEECIITTPWGDWQDRDQFTVIVHPKDKDETHENYYFYYLHQHKLLGKTVWTASMNGGQYSTHAQNNLGEDFDIHYDLTGNTGGVCWENSEHLICFTLD